MKFASAYRIGDLRKLEGFTEGIYDGALNEYRCDFVKTRLDHEHLQRNIRIWIKQLSKTASESFLFPWSALIVLPFLYMIKHVRMIIAVFLLSLVNVLVYRKQQV